MNRFQKFVKVEGVRLAMRRLDGVLFGKLEDGTSLSPLAVIDWSDRTYTVGTIYGGAAVDDRRAIRNAKGLMRRKESGVSFVPA